MKETFKEVMHNMALLSPGAGNDGPENNYGLSKPGEIIHEAGTVRMGNDAKKSALNKWSQRTIAKIYFVWMADSLYRRRIRILHGRSLALSMRASEYIIDEMKKGNL